MSGPPSQKFNDDLLLTEDDRKLAAERFPELFHILDFPELREMFLRYDIPANSAKKHRRRAGFVAILLGVLALLGASVAPLFEAHQLLWPKIFGGFSALLGVVSVLIGSIGTLNGESKERWVRNRLMTERLRQFHFQALICRLPEVLASMVDVVGRKSFLDARKSWFAEFRLAYEGHLPARLKAVMDDDAEDDFLLHHDFRTWQPPPVPNAHLGRVFAAYRLLRLEHQLQYANFKLRTDERLFSSSSVRQLEVLRDMSLAFIFIVFVAHVAVALSLAPGWSGFATNIYIHLGIIWVVIGILALRTLEEGLQPAREVERYARYRSSLMSLMARFDKATDPEEKIRIMQATERTSYQEMRGFLTTNWEARYVL
jgi:membrane protease YdiL (CAAX protease family)